MWLDERGSRTVVDENGTAVTFKTQMLSTLSMQEEALERCNFIKLRISGEYFGCTIASENARAELRSKG